jgi:CRISPR-associated protein Csb2
VAALYTGKSARWLTVTPAVLPGYDDRKLSRAEELVFRAIEHAGIPLSSVRSVSLQKAPFWPGTLHAAAYRVPRYLEGKPKWHVEIVFREPVPGPIAIGDGRHCGLGLMARPRRAP